MIIDEGVYIAVTDAVLSRQCAEFPLRAGQYYRVTDRGEGMQGITHLSFLSSSNLEVYHFIGEGFNTYMEDNNKKFIDSTKETSLESYNLLRKDIYDRVHISLLYVLDNVPTDLKYHSVYMSILKSSIESKCKELARLS